MISRLKNLADLSDIIFQISMRRERFGMENAHKKYFE